MHRKSMEERKTLEAELLIDLYRAEGVLHRCRRHASSNKCLPAARSYSNALRAFSDLILDGIYHVEPKPAEN